MNVPQVGIDAIKKSARHIVENRRLFREHLQAAQQTVKKQAALIDDCDDQLQALAVALMELDTSVVQDWYAELGVEVPKENP